MSVAGSEAGSVLVLGAGPGIGAHVARHYAEAGHPVGLLARDADRLDQLAISLLTGAGEVATAAADLSVPDQVRTSIDRLVGEVGPPAVVVFCPLPDVARIKPVADTTADDLRAAFELSVAGFAAVVQAVLPHLSARGGGDLVVTTGGAVIAPHPDRAVSAVVYAALAEYVDLLQRAVGDDVSVHRVTIVGAVAEDGPHTPAGIARVIAGAVETGHSTVTVVR